MHASRSTWALVVGLAGLAAAQDTSRGPKEPVYRADADQRQELYFQNVQLTDRPPADVRYDAKFRGTRQWYGQIRYGSVDSIRLAVVVDERPDGVDLYFDKLRAREIDAICLLAGNGPDWVVEVETHVGHETIASAKRTVLLRWGPITKTLGIATLGGIECVATTATKPIAVRRLDGNGNGLFNDFADVVMLDIDADRQFDPVTEQFLFRPIVTVAGTRMAVRSNPLTGEYRLEPLTEIGTVAIDWPSDLPPVNDFSASLVSPDGVALMINGVGRPQEAPAGNYFVQTLQFVLIDKDNRRWQYMFTRSHSSESKPSEACCVQAGQSAKCSPLKETKFALEQVEPKGAVAPGRLLELQPKWTTSSGLQISSVTIVDGVNPPSQPRASVKLLNQVGDAVATDSCGFF